MKLGHAAAPLALLLLAGCASMPPGASSNAYNGKKSVLPARILDNYLIVEAKWDRYGPYHFIIDTGSAVTLVTRDLAQRYGIPDTGEPAAPPAPLQSADGRMIMLPAATLRRIELGSSHFDYVPARVYDFADLSAQLGVKIDGMLGFPLFQDVLLTMDYLHGKVSLIPSDAAAPPPGHAIAFNNNRKVPFIPVQLGDRTIITRIDTGDNQGLSVNPIGLDLPFAFGPTEGPTVSTLTGDHTEQIGRLSDTLRIGGYAVPRPVAEVSDEFPTIGGGILKYFTVAFDQAHDQVTFSRDVEDEIAVPGIRTAGMSFAKTPAYWRVVGVIAKSPADEADVEPGDLVTAIDGDPVSKWDLRRFEEAMANAEELSFTFLNGTREEVKKLKIVDLVP